MCMVRIEILMVELIRLKLSGMFYHVDWYAVTDTLEAYVASKFRVSSIISLSPKQTYKKMTFLYLYQYLLIRALYFFYIEYF
jgi:hypothetical protein